MASTYVSLPKQAAASPAVSTTIVDGANTMLVNNDGSINVSGISTVSGTVDTNLNGLTNYATTQYTVTTSVQQLTPIPLAGRSSMIIKVVTTSNTEAVYIGDASVTTVVGFPLFNGDSMQLDLTSFSSIYVIGTSPAQKVYVMELA